MVALGDLIAHMFTPTASCVCGQGVLAAHEWRPSAAPLAFFGTY
jgi:hypothetical protein